MTRINLIIIPALLKALWEAHDYSYYIHECDQLFFAERGVYRYEMNYDDVQEHDAGVARQNAEANASILALSAAIKLAIMSNVPDVTVGWLKPKLRIPASAHPAVRFPKNQRIPCPF